VKYTYNGQPVSVDPMQRKADERRQSEHDAAMEWAEAWDKAKRDAEAVDAERKRQREEANKPPATDSENLAAIRKLLEAQQESRNNG
jgi:hypothetical protein